MNQSNLDLQKYPGEKYQEPSIAESNKQNQIKADLSEFIAKEINIRIRSKSFAINKTLNERRIKYLIPNGVFETQPSYDKVYIYQIPFSESDTYAGTQIVMSEHGARREKEAASRGVLCAAGLTALDHLASHGHQLGDIVTFMKLIPWRFPVECVNGTWLYAMTMSAGAIVGNMDLATRIHSGEIEVCDNGIGNYDHRYKVDGLLSKPKLSLDGNDE